MAVRSKQLGGGAFASGSYHHVYTVPTGYRTILKGIWVRNTFAGANIGKVNLDTVAFGNVYFYFPLVTSGSSGDSQFLNLWVVLEAGDVINIEPTQNNVEAIFAGSELLL